MKLRRFHASCPPVSPEVGSDFGRGDAVFTNVLRTYGYVDLFVVVCLGSQLPVRMQGWCSTPA